MQGTQTKRSASEHPIAPKGVNEAWRHRRLQTVLNGKPKSPRENACESMAGRSPCQNLRREIPSSGGDSNVVCNLLTTGD